MRVERNAAIKEVFKLREQIQLLSNALNYYKKGNHFDIVNDRTRIIDTGAVAEEALTPEE